MQGLEIFESYKDYKIHGKKHLIRGFVPYGRSWYIEADTLVPKWSIALRYGAPTFFYTSAETDYNRNKKSQNSVTNPFKN